MGNYVNYTIKELIQIQPTEAETFLEEAPIQNIYLTLPQRHTQGGCSFMAYTGMDYKV